MLLNPESTKQRAMRPALACSEASGYDRSQGIFKDHAEHVLVAQDEAEREDDEEEDKATDR